MSPDMTMFTADLPYVKSQGNLVLFSPERQAGPLNLGFALMVDRELLRPALALSGPVDSKRGRREILIFPEAQPSTVYTTERSLICNANSLHERSGRLVENNSVFIAGPFRIKPWGNGNPGQFGLDSSLFNTSRLRGNAFVSTREPWIDLVNMIAPSLEEVWRKNIGYFRSFRRGSVMFVLPGLFAWGLYEQVPSLLAVFEGSRYRKQPQDARHLFNPDIFHQESKSDRFRKQYEIERGGS